MRSKRGKRRKIIEKGGLLPSETIQIKAGRFAGGYFKKM
jgi:hypothetical protein